MLKKEIKIYNVLFPIWFLILFPGTWLFILPGNFIIDSFVLLIALKLLKVKDIKQVYKKSIIKVWLFGFLADIVGAIMLFCTHRGDSDWWYEYIQSPVAFNPFDNIWALLYVTLALIISGVAIYLFNLKFSFKKVSLEPKKIHKVALVLAIATAPYLFLVPSQLMYSSSMEKNEVNFFTNHIISYTQYRAKAVKGIDEKVEGEERFIPPDKDYFLAESINTAKRIHNLKSVDENKCAYTIKFYNNDNVQDQTIVYMMEQEPEKVLFKHNDKWYQPKENRMSELCSIINAMEDDTKKEFKLIDETIETSNEMAEIFKDDKFIYYLQESDPNKVFIETEEEGKMDIAKALETHLVSVQDLINKGVKITTKAR